MIRWGIRARKLTVIPNGVDLDRVAFDPAGRARVRAELGIGDDNYVLLLLGRLDQNKRFDQAIEAAAPSLSPRVKVVVVGAGAEREHLEQTARQCGVADYVIFAGERHDVAAVLSAADLLVASSRQETFGLCVLEALANGIQVLYTTCPALEGIKVEGARRVPMEDLGKAIAAVVGAGPGVHAPEPAVAREFAIAAVTARIDDLYERLAARLSWRTATGRLRRRARQQAGARPRVAAKPAGTATSPVSPVSPERADRAGALAGAVSAGAVSAGAGPAGPVPARAVPPGPIPAGAVPARPVPARGEQS
jgi:glycosyltransferase involved in cell wall biosynthesis